MYNLGFTHRLGSVHPSMFAYDNGEQIEPSEVNSVVEPQLAGSSPPKLPPTKLNIWTKKLAFFNEVEKQLEYNAV
ncbi:unnamed protein product [Allacma fusca]|uniref:Uncharacterized protein n=1 Tax=Allacma fusca TaxID=39272 RepID=A0A8J2NUL7_9HEXA|nr:unnamed protein product [Allacma fusca]